MIALYSPDPSSSNAFLSLSSIFLSIFLHFSSIFFYFSIAFLSLTILALLQVRPELTNTCLPFQRSSYT